MRLGLSSAAAPELPLSDLVAACARRGLTALELVSGETHGLDDEIESAALADLLAPARDGDVALVGLHCAADGPDRVVTAVRLAARAGIPAIVPAARLSPVERGRIVNEARAAGCMLLFLHGSDPALASELRRTSDGEPDLGLAWEVDPSIDDPAAVQETLRAAGPGLRYVRFRGGGPEAVEQTGRGVGALMARLALARYAGPLVLTPTTARYRFAWGAWLGRRGGWGCGSKGSDPSLVTLPLAAGE